MPRLRGSSYSGPQPAINATLPNWNRSPRLPAVVFEDLKDSADFLPSTENAEAWLAVYLAGRGVTLATRFPFFLQVATLGYF